MALFLLTFAAYWFLGPQETPYGYQVQQARLADNAVMLFGLAASLSKMDRQLREGAHGPAFERDRAAFDHLFDLFEAEILDSIGAMRQAISEMKKPRFALNPQSDAAHARLIVLDDGWGQNIGSLVSSFVI